MMVIIACVAVGLLTMFFALRAKMAQVNKDVQTIRERREAGIGIPAATPAQENPLTPFVNVAKERIAEIVVTKTTANGVSACVNGVCRYLKGAVGAAVT
jgi:hypothetical protein